MRRRLETSKLPRLRAAREDAHPETLSRLRSASSGSASSTSASAHEVADLQKMTREVITTLKTYCGQGSSSGDARLAAGYASIAMFGNTDQPVDVMVQTGRLFAPMPDVI
jgi:predicted ATP-dependent Lon-type protease